MQTLDFPYPPEKIRNENDRMSVFDVVRKRWFVLTPEEWVRQHLIQYLNRDKECPISLMAVEKMLRYNGMVRRSDLVVYSDQAKPLLLAECKAPEIKITKDVFDQAARYNMTLRVPFLMVTNGIEHFCCRINFENASYFFLKEIPTYAFMRDDSEEKKQELK